MTAYRRVVTGTLVIALAISGAIALLNQAGETNAIVALMAGVFVVDVIGTLYIARLVWEDHRRPRSWLLVLLLTTSLQITVGLGIVDLLVIRGLLGFEPLPQPFRSDLLALAIWLMGVVPIEKAVMFALVQHDRTVVDAASAADGMTSGANR